MIALLMILNRQLSAIFFNNNFILVILILKNMYPYFVKENCILHFKRRILRFTNGPWKDDQKENFKPWFLLQQLSIIKISYQCQKRVVLRNQYKTMLPLFRWICCIQSSINWQNAIVICTCKGNHIIVSMILYFESLDIHIEILPLGLRNIMFVFINEA